MSAEDQRHEIALPQWEIEELSELVSKRVEDKLLARFGRWVVFNLILLGGVAGGGVVAFFNLRSDVEKAMTINSYQEQRMADHAVQSAALRSELIARMDRMGEKIDSLSLQLSAHNGLAARPK